MKKIYKNIISFSIVFIILVALAVLLLIFKHEEIVSQVGLRSTYLLAFAFATITGFSALSSTPFYAIVGALISGGANIIPLALMGGLGLSIGDSAFYFLGKKGREITREKTAKKIRKLTQWIEKKPAWMMPIIIFVYTGLTPLPNDILLIALGITKYPYQKTIPFVIAGNIFFIALIGYATKFGLAALIGL